MQPTGSHLLLVLDNLEHLTGGAGVVATFARECSLLRILVTPASGAGRN